jgi:acyl-CoA synthetase (AMP-forming)/AMP-acid ligase II
MSIDLYVVLLALLRQGITAMFLDPSAGVEHLERCCSICQPRGFVASPKAHLLRLLSPAVRRVPHRFSVGHFIPGAVTWRISQDLPVESDCIPCAPDTPALITFTSGSTGLPKGVVRSHGFLLEQHRVLEKNISLVPGETDLTTLPVFVLANLASGVTSIIPDADLRRPGFIDPGPVLGQIDRSHPQRTVASPAFLERLCGICEKTGRSMEGFRHVFTGGAPVFPNSLQRFANLFSNAEVTAVYGSTEAEPIAMVRWSEVAEADMAKMVAGGGLLAGKPVREIRVKILGSQWGKPLGPLGGEAFLRLCLSESETGEIIVSGAHVLKSYINHIGEEETKIRVDGDIWHRTGDSGYLDSLGRLWLMGRASAAISDDRGTIYPFAVECAAIQHPDVHRAALVRHRGRRVLCVEPVTTMKNIPKKELLSALSWAGIDEVRCLKHIPFDKRHNAKVDYTALQKIIGM